MKPEINKGKIAGKSQNIWRVKNTILKRNTLAQRQVAQENF